MAEAQGHSDLAWQALVAPSSRPLLHHWISPERSASTADAVAVDTVAIGATP
jgi:hypothetical protein